MTSLEPKIEKYPTYSNIEICSPIFKISKRWISSKNWKRQIPFSDHNKMESENKWTTFGSPFGVPSGDKIFRISGPS